MSIVVIVEIPETQLLFDVEKPTVRVPVALIFPLELRVTPVLAEPTVLMPVTTELPSIFRLVAVRMPTDETPVTFKFCISAIPLISNWSAVAIPVTFRSLNVFGAATIAASIVAVVTASREAIFLTVLPH